MDIKQKFDTKNVFEVNHCFDIRKSLSTQKRDRALSILKLDLVAEELERSGGHTGVYLGIRIARERLLRDLDDSTVTEVQGLLWHMALRLEEGLAATAGSDLRLAQRRLQEALDRNASSEELERLLNKVEKTLQEFIQSLMRELRRRGQISPLPTFDKSLTSRNMQLTARITARMRNTHTHGL